MKLKILVVGIALLCAATVYADTLDQMQQLPDKIVVDEQDETLNFLKGMRPDSFYVYEDAALGNSYRQTYRSAICFASITYQPAHVGRMSHAKVKRHIKETTKFQITQQNSYKLGRDTFFMNTGATPEQTTVLMLAGRENLFIKVDMTCQTLPVISGKANVKSAIAWTKKLAETASTLLNEPKAQE